MRVVRYEWGTPVGLLLRRNARERSRHLHVFGLTSEVSVVGTHMSLTMGYHGPSADLLYSGVCVT